MTSIHILKGTGLNCTCGDCAVLYTCDDKECYTTPMNDALDEFDRMIEWLVIKKKNPSRYQVNKCIEWLRPHIRRLENVYGQRFNNKYYCLSVLVFMSWGATAEVRKSKMYRFARHMAYRDVINEMKKPYEKEQAEN